MSAAKHTPGPWQSAHRKKRNGMWDTEVFCANGETIATIAWYPMPTTADGVTGTYRAANASLIAAAPTMLATLQDMDGWLANTGHGADHPWRISIRAALSKAGGNDGR